MHAGPDAEDGALAVSCLLTLAGFRQGSTQQTLWLAQHAQAHGPVLDCGPFAISSLQAVARAPLPNLSCGEVSSFPSKASGRAWPPTAAPQTRGRSTAQPSLAMPSSRPLSKMLSIHGKRKRKLRTAPGHLVAWVRSIYRIHQLVQPKPHIKRVRTTGAGFLLG